MSATCSQWKANTGWGGGGTQIDHLREQRRCRTGIGEPAVAESLSASGLRASANGCCRGAGWGRLRLGAGRRGAGRGPCAGREAAAGARRPLGSRERGGPLAAGGRSAPASTCPGRRWRWRWRQPARAALGARSAERGRGGHGRQPGRRRAPHPHPGGRWRPRGPQRRAGRGRAARPQ